MGPIKSGPIYQHGSQKKTGVLLINLGTPDAPTKKALRSYLKEFLSNTRVIEIPKWIWWLILHGIILNFRPQKSAEKYAQIWMPEGSPLKVHTERQTALLREMLQKQTGPTTNCRIRHEYRQSIYCNRHAANEQARL